MKKLIISLTLVPGLLALANQAAAQPLPPAPEADPVLPAPSEPAAGESETQPQPETDLAARVEAQQAELDAQRKELQALREQMEASAEQPAAADADVQAMIDSVEAESKQAASDYGSGRPLRLYGFMDLGFQKFFVPKSSIFHPVLSTNANTFALGNLNLFLDASPREDWRGLIELRFTNVPHGQDVSYADPLGGRYQSNNRRVYDSESSSGFKQVLLGNVIIERAFIEWSPIDVFNLQAGLWLTPFGIWNVDHGTPTLISLLLPTLQVYEYAPTQQLGLHAKGSTFPTPWELGYHAYVSNGRTPGEHDLTEDKAVGGRLFAAYVGQNWRATVGTSGYYGTYAEVEKRVVGVDPLTIEVNQVVEGREWALGLDLALDVDEKFRLRTEGAMRRQVFEPGKRRPVIDVNPAAVAPDAYELNAYLLAAYRLPWLGLEPYAYVEAVHGPTGFGDTAIVPSVGTNVHFTPEAQLKVQYAHATFHDLATESERTPSNHNFSGLLARLVLAF